MYHGILIDQEFEDSSYPEKFKIIRQKQDGNWRLYAVEVNESELEEAIKNIQLNMKEGTWYAHFYNGEDIVVIFKNRVFKLKADMSGHAEMIEYGKLMGVAHEQLKVEPVDFAGEDAYFK